MPATPSRAAPQVTRWARPRRRLRDAPPAPYPRGLGEALPWLEGGLPRTSPGQVPDYLSPPRGCRFAPRCPDAFERCREMPERVDRASGRQVACWLYDKE